MTAADVMIGREASREELEGVEGVEVLDGLVWKSAFRWGKDHKPLEKKAEGVGLRVTSSKTNHGTYSS